MLCLKLMGILRVLGKSEACRIMWAWRVGVIALIWVVESSSCRRVGRQGELRGRGGVSACCRDGRFHAALLVG